MHTVTTLKAFTSIVYILVLLRKFLPHLCWNTTLNMSILEKVTFYTWVTIHISRWHSEAHAYKVKVLNIYVYFFFVTLIKALYDKEIIGFGIFSDNSWKDCSKRVLAKLLNKALLSYNHKDSGFGVLLIVRNLEFDVESIEKCIAVTYCNIIILFHQMQNTMVCIISAIPMTCFRSLILYLQYRIFEVIQCCMFCFLTAILDF